MREINDSELNRVAAGLFFYKAITEDLPDGDPPGVLRKGLDAPSGSNTGADAVGNGNGGGLQEPFPG